ncbi:capsid cement protein [Haloferula sargassicola]|uniref:Uncharacterized protein n=1 Tax=Haloferula sargassicola TaxID=490096 RepID=A0ABP9UN28_9BACT
MKFELVLGVLALLSFLPILIGLVHSLRTIGRPGFDVCNIGGSYEGGYTRSAEAAVPTPHLLATQGTAANEADICGVADFPIGKFADAAEIDTMVGIIPLTLGKPTEMIASEAIAVDTEVYAAANGKVSDLPADAGDYWKVGRAINEAAADGDELIVTPIYPVKVTVEA